MAVSQLVGAKIHRREDPRLVSGHGRYTDDLTRPGMLHMAVVRSPHAHARIKSIGTAIAPAPRFAPEVRPETKSDLMNTAQKPTTAKAAADPAALTRNCFRLKRRSCCR